MMEKGRRILAGILAGGLVGLVGGAVKLRADHPYSPENAVLRDNYNKSIEDDTFRNFLYDLHWQDNMKKDTPTYLAAGGYLGALTGGLVSYFLFPKKKKN